MNNYILLVTLLLLSFGIPAQAQNDVIKEETISNLDVTGNKNVFFSFAEGAEVDSTAAWDLWFNGSRIQVRGDVLMLDRKFDSVYEAPDSEFLSDDSGFTAFPSGADGWFNYDPTTHIVEPVPQRVFIIKTADSNYAKLQITGYYKDGAMGDDPGAEPRYYSFRYVYRTDGARKLK